VSNRRTGRAGAMVTNVTRDDAVCHMAIVVPPGDAADHTRAPAFYDGTYEYLAGLGIRQLGP